VRRPSRFALALTGIAVVGFAVRLAYGLTAHIQPQAFGDDVWYHVVANRLADGHGFSDPFHTLGPHGVEFGPYGRQIATAFHLPLFPALLSVGSLLGATSYEAHQAMGWALGAGTVVVVGLIGRRLGGDRTGLVAAGVAALYLPLAINDSLLMVESLYGLLVALVLLAVLRLRERPTDWRAACLGAALAAAALSRGEAPMLGLLLVPLILRAGPRPLRTLAVACVAAAVLVAPWVVRNSIVFHRPVGLTTVSGSVVAGANLPSTYHGNLLGAWDFRGLYQRPSAANEAVQSARWRRDALDYAGDHLGRLPVVLAARVGRTWSIYPFTPAAKVTFATYFYRHLRSVEYLALLTFAAVVCLAAYGVGLVRRLGEPVWLFVAPLVLVTLVSLAGFGDTRFRQAADVALAVLAGVGVERVVRSFEKRRAMKGGPVGG
jgi:4-amino-4-deoxy-L-arabinose transferase-like glycosyltransferase